MCKILLSINEEHVENILKGTKLFEFRTRVAKKEVDKLIVYCTSPVKKVVAEVEVLGVLSGSPQEVWKITKNYSGITEDFFNEYFNGRDNAFAYKLGSVLKYEEPLELKNFGLNAAPQSFVYL